MNPGGEASRGTTGGGRGGAGGKPVPTVHIKTKFPVARIKRIMQADEDVGKVAQVTPVIVCKSFFIIVFSVPPSTSYACQAPFISLVASFLWNSSIPYCLLDPNY